VIDIINSVVAGNHHAQGDAPDIRADPPFNIVRLNNSLVGSADGFTVSNPSANNLPFGTDPLLGPLADNGGRTKTHAPLPGSPLVNAGDNARVPAALTTDQRGAGFARIVGGKVDVGAVEQSIAAAPRVTGVYVRGFAWQQAFRDYLQDKGLGDRDAGYLVPAGAGQLLTLPWTGIDRISVRFSAPVTAWLGAFALTNAGGSRYATEFISYDVGTNTATWGVQAPLTRDRLRLDLDEMNGPAGQLDGEWADGVHAYPSGDGTAGGAFSFALNVLPGDVNQSGSVLADDYSAVKKKFFKDTADATNTGYSPLHDVDGSGVILANDFSEVKKRFFDSLPPAAAGAAGATSPAARRIRPATLLLA